MQRSTVAAFGAILAIGGGCADPVGPTRSAPGTALSAVASSIGPTTIATRLVAGKCMDVSGGSTAPGAQLIIWPCHGAANQQFTVPSVGTTGEIRAYNGTMCVDAATGLGRDGDQIVIWPCHGGPNQQWTYTAAGEFRGINGKCIDVAGANGTNGTSLILWTCHGGSNQKWDLTAQPTPPPAVLVGAGDIASCSSTGDEATAALLDGIAGTVFVAGDLAYPDGSAADFANCYAPSWGRHNSRARPVPGNHEYNTPGASAYYAYFGAIAGDPTKGYYSYDVGGWHVVALNSNIDVSGGSAQVQWLRQDLAAHPAACTLAYWHHPRFSSGWAGSDARFQPFWQALYDAGAEIVISGHDHDYERFAPQTPAGDADPSRGIRQFVVGTGGASLLGFNAVRPNSEFRYNATWGVIKLELGATGYAWSFIATDRVVKDAGTGSCH